MIVIVMVMLSSREKERVMLRIFGLDVGHVSLRFLTSSFMLETTLEVYICELGVKVIRVSLFKDGLNT